MNRWIGLFLGILAGNASWAETQLAAGDPISTEKGTGLPFYLYSSDNITAGQFDISVPDGWSLKAVETDPRFRVTHELDSDRLGSGQLRVVFYSLVNAPLSGGTLGRVILQPPESAPPLEIPDFQNPLFADPNGDAFGLSTGFPALQILAHPQSVSILAGQRAQLSLSVVGIDPVYQWYEGPQGETGTPVGSGSGVFQTPALAETTTYWVRVSDDFGSVLESNAATVTVTGELPLVLEPNFATVPATTGTGSFAVSTGAGKSWNASTDSDWISIVSGIGPGSGTVIYRYRANTGLSLRTATISVGDVTFTLTQGAAVSPFASVPPLEGNPHGWKQVPELGWLVDSRFPYVYHFKHGWLYFHHDGPGQSFQIYSLNGDFGWMMTGTLFANGNERWLYSYEREAFLLLLPDSTPRQRKFFDPVEDQVITIP